MKRFLKKLSKSKLIQNLFANILFYYLWFVGVTSRKELFFQKGFDKKRLYKPYNYIFVYWHQNLALSTIIFGRIGAKLRPVVSSHSDGRLLKNLINKYGCRVISGSTNSGAIAAVKEIIKSLRLGDNIIITPDGPKGPAKKINSNLSAIAFKTSSFVIPVNFSSNRFFELNSWDRMRIPLPFSRIKVEFSSPISPTGQKEEDKKTLETELK